MQSTASASSLNVQRSLVELVNSSEAVGRTLFDGTEANPIDARKAVPPACPTVAYSKDTALNSSVSIG